MVRRFLVLLMLAAVPAWVACGSPNSSTRALNVESPDAAASLTSVPATSRPEASNTPVAAATSAPETAVPAATSTPAAYPPTVEPIATRSPPCRRIEFTPGDTLRDADLVARGTGEASRGPFLGTRLVIRKIGVDVPFVVRVVGPSGVMPEPGSTTAVAWYDFSAWPGLGGSPGTDRGNVIIAGNYDSNGVPQAVFYRVSELVPGDLIQIDTSDGRTLAYEVEFNKIASQSIDWSGLVAATQEESVTLITAMPPTVTNPDRRIVWGRALDTACSR